MTQSIFRSTLAALLLLTAGGALIVPGMAQTPCPTDLPLAEPGKLVMSINATIPPTQYVDKDGNLIGLNVDFGNEIAKRLCLEPSFQNVSFEVQIPGLQNKRWDMIDTGLYYTEERAKIMQLVPYTIDTLALIVASGNPLGIAKPEDLAGRIVGVEIGGFEEEKIREIDTAQVAAGLPAMDIRVFNSYGDTFLALGAGQIEAVFTGDTVGKYYEKQGQFTMAVTGLFPGNPSAFATAEPALAEAIVAVLNDMREDGSYDAMMTAAGATTIDHWANWTGEFISYYTPE